MRAPAARVVYSCLFFVLTMALVMVARPRALFDESGRPRPFGTGPGTTVFPFGVVVVVSAVLSMYVFVMIDLIWGT